MNNKSVLYSIISMSKRDKTITVARKKTGVIEVFNSYWPSQSPDLSLSEHQLKLIDQMLCICQAVIQAKGGLDEDNNKTEEQLCQNDFVIQFI